jgi:hypothetical protein
MNMSLMLNQIKIFQPIYECVYLNIARLYSAALDRSWSQLRPNLPG